MSTPRPADTIQQTFEHFDGVSSKLPADRHYFVPDLHGYYCDACSLPRSNKRHVQRAA